MPTSVDDLGQDGVAGDEECTKTDYIRNTNAWILGLSQRVRTTATRYYSFGGGTVASRAAIGLTWLANDQQGTASLAIEAGTQHSTMRRQTPYGGPRGTSGAWSNNRGFVGGVLDKTGLTHLGARQYDPVIGRFVSVDPVLDLGDPQQWNAYAYADNNPIVFADPSGLFLGSASCTGGMVGGPGACSGYEDPAYSGPPRGGNGGYSSMKETLPNGTTYASNVDGRGTARINGVHINLTNKATTYWLMAEALDRYKGDHPPSVPGQIDQDDDTHTLLGVLAAFNAGYLNAAPSVSQTAAGGRHPVLRHSWMRSGVQTTAVTRAGRIFSTPYAGLNRM